MSYAVPLLKELLKRRRPGHTLEAPFYLSPEVCRADTDLIFGREWVFVGVAPQVAEAGDYITVEIGHNSVLVVRDDDMAVRAFHNVCRHRGSRLCNAASGSVGNVVCPYHQWTYDLSGKLINADHMGDDFDRSGHGLKPVHLRNLEGLLFICLADEPPADFDDMARAMLPYMAPHRLEDCKVAHQEVLIENGNWKLTMENNRECYHCMVNHPELTVSMFEQGFGYQPGPQSAEGVARFERIVAESTARWEGMGLPSREIDLLDGRAVGYRTQRLPLDRSGQSQTLSTEVACTKLLGDLTEPALGGLSFWTQPNSWHHFMSDHVVSFSVLPISEDRTLLRTVWCVHKDAREGHEYDVENLVRVWRATNEQDGRLVAQTQAGVASGAYEPGPYSPFTEGLVDKFCNWYTQRLSAHVGL
jgi:Rieske 2Fe-2S family protein